MPRIRQSAICLYCKSVINLPGKNQYYCSLGCRFWSKVEILGPDKCWNWTAKKFYDGYGRFWYKGSIQAHRIAWLLTYGPIPKGLCTLHHCDNGACCNSSHLFLGTKADNAIDMVQKGRQHSQKLTAEQIKAIKIELVKGITQRILAKKYGVTIGTICHIKTGRTWSHI